MIDFPPAPNDGDTYVDPTGSTWTYNINTWLKHFDTTYYPTSLLAQVPDIEVSDIPLGYYYLKFTGTGWDLSTWEVLPDNKSFSTYIEGDTVIARVFNKKFPYTNMKYGSGFSTSTDEWTVPVTGYYEIAFRITQGLLKSYTYQSILLVRNNRPLICLMRPRGNASAATHVRETFQYLRAGDKLHIDYTSTTNDNGPELSFSISYDDHIYNNFRVRLLEETEVRPTKELIGLFATYRYNTLSLYLEAGTYEIRPILGGAMPISNTDYTATNFFCNWTSISSDWWQAWNLRYYCSQFDINDQTSYSDNGSLGEALDVVLNRIDFEPLAPFTLTSAETVNFNNNTGGSAYPATPGTHNQWTLWKTA